jgi:hypothetical protein
MAWNLPPTGYNAPHERNVAMRTRAYRPEAPRCLEDRSMLSGVVGPSADPVVFPRGQLIVISRLMQSDFLTFSRSHNISDLRHDLNNVILMVPFGRADGLVASISRILDTMRHDLHARVPNAARTGLADTFAVVGGDISARVRAGDLVIR